jgi:hypothetical protein
MTNHRVRKSLTESRDDRVKLIEGTQPRMWISEQELRQDDLFYWITDE